ncbi:hypothetical protein LCGC14_0176250 [marine sediment metagenome]|uniref:DOD-type homing endonuclease domain-containing protein n=1 Tax=marine sediment metagenome TaxID=412755 RepID=A0A0F9X9U1_9ZZZZ
MTNIEWTEKTLNVTAGCSKISEGCKNCYAEKMHNNRLLNAGQPKYQQPFNVIVEHRSGKGTMQSIFDEIWNRKKPTIYFVNSMSDLFHEEVSMDWIYTTMHNLMSNNQHIFQILTKRPEGILEYEKSTHDTLMGPIKGKDLWSPNIWMGTSVENQKRADKRIPHLIKSSAHLKFLSCEPLLGPLDLSKYLPDLDWVIVGGECLTKNALISTPNGYKRIYELSIGDNVYSYDGELYSDAYKKPTTNIKTKMIISKIKNKMENGIKEIFELKTKTRTIQASQKHKFLRLNIKPIQIGSELIRHEYSLEWTQLNELKKGDFIVIQKSAPEQKTPLLIYTEDFMRIVGLFIGDGWIRLKRHELSFAMNTDSNNRLKYIPLLEKEFKKKIHTDKSQIHIYDKEISKLFDDLDLNYKELEKHIPDWVWQLPKNHKKSLIDGYLDSDGTIDNSRKSPTWVFEARNKTLIEEMWALCLDVGYHVTSIHSRERIRGIWKTKNKDYNYNKPVTNYYFKVSHNRIGYKATSIRSISPVLKGFLPTNFAVDHIQYIKPIGSELTYDLEIENSHNYIANGILVHNSGTKAKIREFDLEWARDIRMQCFKYSTPFFFKQSGTLLPCTTEAHKKCSKKGCTADPCKNRKHRSCGAKGCTFLDGVKYKEMPKR